MLLSTIDARLPALRQAVSASLRLSSLDPRPRKRQQPLRLRCSSAAPRRSPTALDARLSPLAPCSLAPLCDAPSTLDSLIHSRIFRFVLSLHAISCASLRQFVRLLCQILKVPDLQPFIRRRGATFSPLRPGPIALEGRSSRIFERTNDFFLYSKSLTKLVNDLFLLKMWLALFVNQMVKRKRRLE